MAEDKIEPPLKRKEFEERFHEFGKNLARLEEMILSLSNKISKSYSDQEKKLNDHLCTQEHLNTFLRNKIFELENCINRANLEISRVDSKEIKESPKIAILFDLLSLMKKDLVDFQSKINVAQEVKSLLHPVELLANQNKERISSLEIDLIKSKKNSEAFEKSISKEIVWVRDVATRSSGDCQLEKISNEKFKSVFNKFSSEVINNFSVMEQKSKEYIDAKASAIKIPLPDNMATKQDIQNLIDKIELSSLDAKNAYLKSNQAEMQVQINSKKLENLSLLLKQIETKKG